MAQSEDERALRGALADAEASMHKGRAGSLVLLAGFGLGAGRRARVPGRRRGPGARVRRDRQARERPVARQLRSVLGVRAARRERHRHQEQRRARHAARRPWRRNAAAHTACTCATECMPKLEDIGPKLDTLIVPQELQADITALKQANATLRASLKGLVAYLDNPELDYDEAAAKPCSIRSRAPGTTSRKRTRRSTRPSRAGSSSNLRFRS